MSFNASFEYGQFFLKYFLPKFVKKCVSLPFVDSSKNFLYGCTNKKIERGFVRPTGLPGEAFASFLGYARLLIGGVAKVL